MNLSPEYLFTWFDVERRIHSKTARYSNFPPGIRRISVYPSAIEIHVDAGAVAAANQSISEWFSPSELTVEGEQQSVHLLIGGATIPVVVDDEATLATIPPLLPLWERMLYHTESSGVAFEPTPALQGSRLFAFHSFKGGVGRTTAMMAFASAFAISNNKPVLLVDADLEAPGITYWLPQSSRARVSFAHLIEAIHSPPTSLDDVVDFFTKELRKSTVNWEGRELFVLPAFTTIADLLNARVDPQHLVNSKEARWSIGTVLHRIAAELGTAAVFVDLRAGLSELSSPILFDGRFERFLVTSLAEQSIAGTSLVLEMLKKATKAHSQVPHENHPCLVLSLVTQEMKEGTASSYLSARERTEAAYGLGIEEDDAGISLQSELSFFESPFSEDLMILKDFDSAIRAIQATHLYEEARTWFHPPPAVEPAPADSIDASTIRLGVRARERVYAENEVPTGFLTTEALINLGRAYCDDIPNAVLIGAKGSGKTFSYLQIALSRSWDQFLTKLGLSFTADTKPPLLVPLLRSTELSNATFEAVRACFEDFQKSNGLDLAEADLLGFSEPTDLIKQELSKASTNVLEWTEFWVSLLAKAVASEAPSLRELNLELLEQRTNVVFLLDGLEDLFQHVDQDPVQRSALEALIDVPNRIRELRQPSLGLLVFVREDYAKLAKAQNFGQFQARYAKFQLNWSAREFLQLVYWLCADAGVIGADKSIVDSMTTDQLVDSLVPLWGKKLGRNDAAEAYTARWVYSALSDLRGRLQARDVVRFISHAATQSESKRLGVWMDR